MGAWGHKALESDSALNAIDAINETVIKKLRKELKTSTKKPVWKHYPDLSTQRVAAEYMIKLHKAGLLSSYDIADSGLGEQAIVALQSVKKVLEDLNMWAPDGRIEALKEAQRETNKDIGRQIRYIRKVLEAAGHRTEVLLEGKKRIVIVQAKKKTTKKRKTRSVSQRRR
jgi:hypothetical protein